MNEEIKAQWIAALRSGEYVQGQGTLHSVDEYGNSQFCCLGVLCDLAVKAGLLVEKEKMDSVFSYDGDRAILPPFVLHWSGLRNAHGLLSMSSRDTYGYVSLAGMNDAGVSFEEIADVIEEEEF